MKDVNDSEINVPRTVKKAAIGWGVPAFLGLICLGFVALSKVQVQGMLVDYQTKEKAAQDMKDCRAQIEIIQNQISIYAHEVTDMQSTLIIMDKKLDHLQYVVEFSQDHQRFSSPKAKDNP